MNILVVINETFSKLVVIVNINQKSFLLITQLIFLTRKVLNFPIGNTYTLAEVFVFKCESADKGPLVDRRFIQVIINYF